jgi:hypothetical protein
LRLLQFVAVILTALALVPSGAHMFELPHKIALTEEQYFVVQSIYRGWSLFGAVVYRSDRSQSVARTDTFPPRQEFLAQLRGQPHSGRNARYLLCMDPPRQ